MKTLLLLLSLFSVTAFAQNEDINFQGSEKYTKLHLAVRDNDLVQVDDLLKKGANVEIQDMYGRTPLFYSQNPQITQLLLQHKANPNSPDNWRTTPLHRAAKYGNVAIAELLIDAGADVTEIDNWGCSALHKAAASNSILIAKEILRKSGNINSKCYDGETALYYAAGHANFEMVKFLVEEGADISATTNAGITILDIAKNDRGMLRPITLNSDAQIIKSRNSIVALLESKAKK